MPGTPIKRARRGGIRLADGTVIAFPKLTHPRAGLSHAEWRALSPGEKLERLFGISLEPMAEILAWPVAETDSHWITLGLDKDLNVAMMLAARNAIKFLAAQAKISELDAYALCSIAVSFRVTQVVDIVRGVHALIPKSIFAPQLRREMTMV